MVVLTVLLALAIAAMSGAFGYRGGVYRGPGIVVGLFLVLVAFVLIVSGAIR